MSVDRMFQGLEPFEGIAYREAVMPSVRSDLLGQIPRIAWASVAGIRQSRYPDAIIAIVMMMAVVIMV